MSTEKKTDGRHLTIGSEKNPVRFSYANLFEPKVEDENKIDKKTGKPAEFYSVQVIISKKDEATVAAINGAVSFAAKEKLGDKKIPTMWKLPLRDGDEEWEEKGEHLKGAWFFNCKSKGRPNVVGTRKYTEEDVARWDENNELQPPEYIARNRPKVGKLVPLDSEDFKSGDYGRISIDTYYFEAESKGIAVGLGNVQKLKDGDSLGGTRTSADDDFGDLEDGFKD
jgi:hypothetical protein